jgi:CRP-like cAMP-binding protein
MPPEAMDILGPAIERVTLARGDSLFEPGDQVPDAHFPIGCTVISLSLPMRDGRAVEAATIGREGAVGGVVSLGLNPAFARATVQIAGEAVRLSIASLEAAKRAAPQTQDLLARYADCLTAQVLQSVACAALHPLEARCARWLLMSNDRLREERIPLTQEALAEMLGVGRTYVNRIAGALEERGAIRQRRGVIHIADRAQLEGAACECYCAVRQHFGRVLPGLYPDAEP